MLMLVTKNLKKGGNVQYDGIWDWGNESNRSNDLLLNKNM